MKDYVEMEEVIEWILEMHNTDNPKRSHVDDAEHLRKKTINNAGKPIKE